MVVLEILADKFRTPYLHLLGTTVLPLADANDLYVRETYNELYNEITRSFKDKSIREVKSHCYWHIWDRQIGVSSILYYPASC